jgi:hypothetical protein
MPLVVLESRKRLEQEQHFAHVRVHTQFLRLGSVHAHVEGHVSAKIDGSVLRSRETQLFVPPQTCRFSVHGYMHVQRWFAIQGVSINNPNRIAT